jgi:hypothetical protein
MNGMEGRLDHNLDKALAGYNWGESRVHGAVRRVAAIGLPGADAWKRVIPKETSGYIANNARYRAQIRARYAARQS